MFESTQSELANEIVTYLFVGRPGKWRHAADALRQSLWIVDINNCIVNINNQISTMYVHYWYLQFLLSISIIHELHITNCQYRQLVLVISTIPIVDKFWLLIATIQLLISAIRSVDINKLCPLLISAIPIADIDNTDN